MTLDAGCSEGFYLNRLAKALPGADCYGLDISRSAMRLASRAYGNCTWAVANIAQRLPLADGSCDLILSLMAPRNTDEFQRAMKERGRLLVVIPGDRHLGQLTDHLMSEPSDQSSKPGELTQSLSSSFDLISTESIQHDFQADRDTILKIVTMTPLRWKSSRKSLESLKQVDSMHITAAFRVLQYAFAE